jgi:hypothetical protein
MRRVVKVGNKPDAPCFRVVCGLIYAYRYVDSFSLWKKDLALSRFVVGIGTNADVFRLKWI